MSAGQARAEKESARIERRLEALYGTVDWAAAGGLLHVAAVEGARRRVIAIGPHSPPSAADRFVLGAARARSDALVTSGAVLRAEPRLVHRLAETAAEESGLQAWRLHRLGRSRPPQLIVLTREGEIPVHHPALQLAPGGFVWTSEAGRARLGGRVGALDVIAGIPPRAGGRKGPGSGLRSGRDAASVGEAGGLAEALEHALSQPGVETVLVEAGPSLASSLYPDPERDPELDTQRDPTPGPGPGHARGARVEELLLSRFEGALDDRAVGPPFLSEGAIGAAFGSPPSAARVEEPSGVWTFLRYRRDGAGRREGQGALERGDRPGRASGVGR